MNLRRVPAALVLGLPAALTAHGIVFGDGHELGGGLHGALLWLTGAVVAGFTAALAALAWQGRRTASGSILAARLAAVLPAAHEVFFAAALAFGACEALEAEHAGAPAGYLAAALLLASWLVLAIARAFVSTIAEITIAVVRSRCSAAEAKPRLLSAPQTSAASAITDRRLFARPPPAFGFSRA